MTTPLTNGATVIRVATAIMRYLARRSRTCRHTIRRRSVPSGASQSVLIRKARCSCTEQQALCAPSYPTPRTWTHAHKHHLVPQGSTTSARMGASTSLGGRAVACLMLLSIHTSARMLQSVATRKRHAGQTTAATRCTTVSYFAPIVRRPHSSCQQTVTLLHLASTWAWERIFTTQASALARQHLQSG